MSWTDKASIRVITQLRDKFNIKTFVETGTYKGINAQLQNKHFAQVLTCEIDKNSYTQAKERLKYCSGVNLIKLHSPDFLKIVREDKSPKIYYLDAHFYNPDLPKKKRFVVLDELKALKDINNCIIIIHDFDNNLGHITYDGQPLNLQLIKKDLMKVNPNFKLYTNELSSCDIVTPNWKDILNSGLNVDKETLNNLEYAWTCPRLTYRGILYALPGKVNIDGIKLIE